MIRMARQCIIGCGASGILLILLLIQSGQTPLDQILVIDPYFDGGDLTRKWSSVISNTPWSVTYKSIKKRLPSFQIPAWAESIAMEQPTPLSTISKLLRELLKPYMTQIQLVQGYVKGLEWTDETAKWKITVLSESIKVYESARIIMTTGSTSKLLDLPIPTIPLEIALDKRRLQDYGPLNKVIVFGTAHSGTLVLKNLVDCQATRIIAVHHGLKPFKWARDGVYDGLKLEAAVIADEIVHLQYPSIQCIPITSLTTIFREGIQADWVVYAIGFDARQDITVTVNGGVKSLKGYDGITGKLSDVPNAWGFGIAYPSRAPDRIHWDVGISSFLDHIHTQLNAIF